MNKDIDNEKQNPKYNLASDVVFRIYNEFLYNIFCVIEFSEAIDSYLLHLE